MGRYDNTKLESQSCALGNGHFDSPLQLLTILEALQSILEDLREWSIDDCVGERRVHQVKEGN